MTHVTMLCPTVRPAMFMRLLDSFDILPQASEYWLAVHFQGYTQAEIDAVKAHRWASRIVYAVKTEHRIQPYICRAAMYRAVPAEVYISLDDDMVVLPTVDWASAVAKAMEPGVGVISCNCVKSQSPALVARAKYEPTFIKSVLTFMSGGQVYSNTVAKLALQAPVLAYWACDLQLGLLAYVAGLENYRYLGSLIEHNVGSPGGIKEFPKGDRVLPDPRYLAMRNSGKGPYSYLCPTPADITKLAHDSHNRNKEKWTHAN